MKILDEKIRMENLKRLENVQYFPDMVKAVVDIEAEAIALNAELHADLEEFMIESGFEQKNLYGINIRYDERDIEFDSVINAPRNRDAGFLKVSRYVADPIAREKIAKVVHKWIEF